MERKTVIGTGGELLVHQLLAQGVEFVFTNTGSAEAGFFNGLLAVPGVQPILLLAEPLVLSAADGYAKSSGKPAFVNVHLAAGTRQGSGQQQQAATHQHLHPRGEPDVAGQRCLLAVDRAHRPEE